MDLSLVIAVAGLLAALWWGRHHAVARRRLEADYAALDTECKSHAARQQAVNEELEAALGRIDSVQDQLVQSKRMASLGQLTAGIAHEIKNPLNFVNNFAQLSVELAAELHEELGERADQTVGEAMDEIGDLIEDLQHNAEKITEHGQRADRIVRNMLLHSRSNPGQRQPVDLNGLFLEYANLAYHGMRAADAHFNVTIEKDLDPEVGEVAVIPQELGRVFINLLNNAFHATEARVEAEGRDYHPTILLGTRALPDAVEVRVYDNGTGMPEDIQARIFEPFFTTKPTGVGTGLGLSLSHEIVAQRHGGTMTVESEEGEGTTFLVVLPREVPEAEMTAPHPTDEQEGNDE